MEKLLTRKELAEQIGLSERTLKTLQRLGVLPVVKLSHRITRFHPAAVEAAIRRHTLGGFR